MAKQQNFNGNKIKELIKESKKDKLTYDGSIWTRTCKEEIINPIEGIITGDIPRWINGSFLQNGPGAFEIGDVMFNHVFDGMALLHRFNIANGKVTYQNRFIKSRAYEAVKNENRIAFSEFGTTSDPVGSVFSRFISTFKFKANSPTDNTSVTIFPIGEDFYALTETTKIHKFDTKTLETLDRICLGRYVDIVVQPAHPIVSSDGSLFNIGLSMSATGAQYIIFCIPNVEKKFENIKIISKFQPKRKNYPSYMHSFAMTENYFVVVEQPFTISGLKLAKSLLVRNNFSEAFKWFENESVFIHLIDRQTGVKAHTFEAETFFFYHTINAYEENDHVIFDLTCYKCPDIIDCMSIENMRDLKRVKAKITASRPLRFVFPLKYSVHHKSDKNLITLSGTDAKAYMQENGNVLCFPELLCDIPFEFGTLYYQKYHSKKYRYLYGNGMDFHTEFPGQLIKIDCQDKSVITWYEENVYPSEPLFIPSPNATSEDDGVVVSALLRGKEDTNCIGLLILDAKSFKEVGRCEFKDLPTPVPKSFHGWFLNE